MKNVTLSVPDDVFRAARIRAAERGTSLSAMVGEYLRSLSELPGEFERLEARQEELRAEIVRFRGGDRIERDALHRRAVR